METKNIAKLPYRKVVAELRDCEERYGELVKSIDAGADTRLAFALKSLKREVKKRGLLEAELLTAVERERHRIGQDLHDDLCQRLGAAALIAGSLAKRIQPKDPHDAREFAKLPSLINETIENCRVIARGLVPVTLERDGLPAALTELAATMPHGVGFKWTTGKRIPLRLEVALHLFRIAEEAVANALKHGRADEISVDLDLIAGRPVLVITDNGKGFGKKLQNKGMGLRNMHYRAAVIGGKLTVERHVAGGTRVLCKLRKRP